MKNLSGSHSNVRNTPKGDMAEVTLVVTSCNRHDLLKKTLKSFIQQNTFPIKETLIVEDSVAECPAFLHEPEYHDALGIIKFIRNERSRGQIYSIDRAYSEVTTEYIFHCEDDWEFIRPDFIKYSLNILEANPHFWTVNLRADKCNGHPVDNTYSPPFGILEPYWNGGWGGLVFNPGLRRLSDYKKLGSYGRHMGYSSHGFEAELKLSIQQLDQGFRIASLPDEYIKHIGDNRSRAADIKFAPKPPKVLIAIPACHKYEYKSQSDGRIHKDGTRNERVEAVRNTWQKYLPPFTNVTQLFFYGRQPNGQEIRQPLADEVFLDVADDYMSLPHKVKAIVQYARANGYDFIFKGDDDTFIYVDRLMASGFEDHDYLGFKTDDSLYCSGGSGYWLSAKAMDALLMVPVSGWAEDRWVGEALLSKGIKPTRDARYLPGFWEHFVDVNAIGDSHSYITMHACTPKMMDELFAKTLTPNFKKIQRAFHELEDKFHIQAAGRRDTSSPHQGVPKANPVLKYSNNGLTLDWWDTHERPEKKDG